MQKEFLPLVDDAVGQVRNYFKERFLSAYLHGSLNYGDAVPNVSDMDCYIVIKGNLSDADTAWIRDMNDEVDKFLSENGFERDLSRPQLGNIITSSLAKKIMGYEQMDYYTPIKEKQQLQA